jgi:hypothetical protein
VPAALIETFENVATPLSAVTGLVPESVPDPGFVPMATAIEADDVVTTIPEASSTLTTTAGEIVPPCVALAGSTVKTSCVATLEMSKLALVVLVSPVLDAVRVTPDA